MRDSDARMERERQKNADRVKLESNEKSSLETAAAKAKDAENKQAGRTAKQAAAAEEVRKYNERLEKAKERQARTAKNRASQSSPSASPPSGAAYRRCTPNERDGGLSIDCWAPKCEPNGRLAP